MSLRHTAAWISSFLIVDGLLLLPSSGLAQSGQPESRQLEEVVVTAQKRAESLQDVPISISVVNSEELSELSIFDFTETAKLTPGVDFFPGVQSAAIRLRGVGPAFFALTAPQSVAVFVDEFAQSSVGTVFSTLVDIERVELLRGPQGTLYGQNAPGGAYNIFTRTPDTDSYSGYLETSYGLLDSSSRELVDVRGAVNVPLVSDSLAIRIAGVYADSDGPYEVDNPVASIDSTGGKEHSLLRTKALWVLDDNLNVTWTVAYSDLTDNLADFNVEGVVPGTGGSSGITETSNRFKDRKFYGDFESVAETDLLDTNMHWKWMPGFGQVDFLASYQEFDTYSNDNREPYPNRSSQFEIDLNWEMYTGELRFSDSTDFMDYLAGIYYSQRDIDGFFNLTLGGTNLLGPAGGTATVAAAYANGTVALGQGWDLSIGMRYDDNEVETQSEFKFLGFESTVDGSEDYEHLSWSVKLRNYINDDTTAYLAIDNAYKQGGFNNLIPGTQSLGPIFPVAAELGSQMLQFDEETSTAIEIGVKGSALEKRLSYSAAVFYQIFEDHQITQPTEVAVLQTPAADLNALWANQLTNAEEVLTKGVELDLVYLLADNWDISLRAAYFDATIEDWDFRFCQGGEEQSPDQALCPADSGDPLNDLPKWNTNVQLGYQDFLTDNWTIYSRLSWSWQSAPNYTTYTSDFSESKNVYDVTIGTLNLSWNVDVKLWGKNLTNEDLNVNPGLQTAVEPGQPIPYNGNYFPGRQYGITVNYSF